MALCGYLKLTDQQGNLIRGECDVEEHQHWIRIWGSSHAVQLPTNEHGLPSGKRVHHPIKLIKLLDGSSPLLYQHLCAGKLFREAQIDWYRIRVETGEPEMYFRMMLTDVQLSAIGFEANANPASDLDDQQLPRETLELIYDEISWTFMDGGIEFGDRQKPKPPVAKAEKRPLPKKIEHRVQWEIEADDTLPVPDGYKGHLLVYNKDEDQALYNTSSTIFRPDVDSSPFKLQEGTQFEAFFIEPHQHNALAEVKFKKQVKQAVAEGEAAPLTIRDVDVNPRGQHIHYAPVTLKIEREVQLLVEYSEDIPVTFELRSSKTETKDTTNHGQPDRRPNEPHHLIFDSLDGKEEFALYAHQADLPPMEVVPALPLADWLKEDVLLEVGIGSNGGPQLHKYELIDGHIPKLTFIPAPPQFGLFFDGTGNNKTNDNKVIEDDKEPTNIAKLSELYPREAIYNRHYSDGIGTKEYKEDNWKDLGTAYSLDERINRALDEMVNFFEGYSYAHIGFVDIFGFSRGATQARMMVNVIHYLNKNYPHYWGGKEKIQTRRGIRKKFNKNSKIKLVVRFVGIYDTVGSVGIGGDNDNQWFWATGGLPGSPDTATLDIAADAACAVYHLGALDECRANFPLSSIKTSKNAVLPKHYIEEDVLGVHADVGGGYSSKEELILFPTESFPDPGEVELKKKIASIKQKLESDHYRPGINIEFNIDKKFQGKEGVLWIYLKPYWKRNANKYLSFIYLENMHQKALQYGVPFKPLDKLDPIYDYQKYIDDQKIRPLHNRAKENGFGSQEYNDLYESYIHHSHRYAGIKDAIAFGPESDPVNSYGNYGREVYYAENKGMESDVQWEIKTSEGGAVQWYKK